MDTRDFTGIDSMGLQGSLAAIFGKPHAASEVFILDLAEEINFATALHATISSVIANNLTILADAKSDLESWDILPEPRMRVLCLTTIKKLIAKNHNETLNLPTFDNAKEALTWIKNAAH